MTGLRRAVAMFTVLPVPSSWHGEGRTAGADAAATLRWLPMLGLALGAVAGTPAAAVLARDRGLTLMAAVLGVATLAALSRGLHLDGLADTADGLASRTQADQALEIMRRSDIGPFGVLAVVLVVLIDVSAVDAIAGAGLWMATAAFAVAAGTGRLAVLHAALPGVRAARPDGFGALVAGRAGVPLAALQTALVLAVGAGVAALVGADPLSWPVVQALALTIAAVLRMHTSGRFGGITGDVFGALIEVTTAATLVGLALAR